MLDFEQYRKDRDELDAKIAAAALEYEQELRGKPINVLTPEEIGALCDLNENFKGNDVNADKLRQYAALKEAVAEFLSACDEAVQLTESAPSAKMLNAVIRLDVKAITTMNKTEAGLLAKALKLADFMVVSLVDDCIRYSFSVEKIWKSQKKE